jgi:putative acetyltransferase
LVIQGLEELQLLKPDGCLLFGDPNYYHRFGFSPSERFHHEGRPSHMLLAVRYALTDSHGAIRFQPAFYELA